MDDNAEAGIARTQAAAARANGAKGPQAHHTGTIAYLDERILVFLMAMAMIGLIVVWMTAKSPLVFYGSLAAVILLTFLWGYARIRRIEAERIERARQASDWQSKN